MDPLPLSRRLRCAGLTFLTSLTIGLGIARGATATVSVDASQVLRTVDDRMFGINTAVWDGVFKNAQTVPLLQEMDVRFLRFPGGSTSDTYDWQTNKSYQTGTRTLNNWSWTNSFDDFAPVAQAINAQVIITANYGSGTAQQAADWVKYSNVTHSYGFKYWEIGNECYGSWEEDIHNPQWDPVTYANQAKDYIAAMKAVDPTIKIGVVVEAGEDDLDSKSPKHSVTNPRTSATHQGWTPVMLTTLASLGVTPDYVIYHRYPLAPNSETDAKLLSGVSISNTTWADDISSIRRQLNDYLGSSGPGVDIYVTENNDVYTDPGKQSTSLVNGLFLADGMGQLLQTEARAFMWWAFHNGTPKDSNGNILGNFSSSLYGWRTYGDYGVLSQTNDRHPTFYAFKLLSHFLRAGDSVVKASSSDPLLAVYAARRTNGTLTLLVINKSPTDTYTGNFTVSGFSVGGTATTTSYGKPQDDAAKNGTGATDLATGSLSGLAASFHTDFAPYSMTVVALDAAAPSVPQQVTAYASSSTEVTLTWQPPATNGTAVTNYKIERATDSGFTQGLVSIEAGGVTSYVDSTAAAGTTYYYRVTAINAAGNSPTSAGQMVATPSSAGSSPGNLVNIAARAYCAPGNSVTIGGFVITGSGKKRVLIRAVGPSLSATGIGAGEILADPVLELHSGNQVVAQNDDWGTNGNAAEITSVAHDIGATALQSTDTKSSALLTDLDPGAYTFVVHGANNTSGVVLLEVYDADTANTAARFVNIATRGFSNTGNGVAIGGFVISGNAPKTVLVRGVGPTLATLGLNTSEVLSDPTIELHQGSSVIGRSDNWFSNGNSGAIPIAGKRIGASPLASSDTKSAVLLMKLMPGAYTFIASGQNGGTGVVLVEVYDAD